MYLVYTDSSLMWEWERINDSVVHLDMFLWTSELEHTISKGRVHSAVSHCLLYMWEAFGFLFMVLIVFLNTLRFPNTSSPNHSWNNHHHCTLFPWSNLTWSNHSPLSMAFCGCALHWIGFSWHLSLMDGWHDFWHPKSNSVHLFRPQCLVCRQCQWCREQWHI